MRKSFILLGLVAIGASVAFIGCSNPPATTANKATSGTNQSSTDHSGDQHADHDGHDHANHDHANHDQAAKSGKSDMDKMKEGLAGLSEEDRASAMKQHFCPVSGEMLGLMGAPKKITVNDQEVWICCDACEKDIKADPEKYLAKLKK